MYIFLLNYHFICVFCTTETDTAVTYMCTDEHIYIPSLHHVIYPAYISLSTSSYQEYIFGRFSTSRSFL